MRYSIEGGNLPAVMINLEAGETIIVNQEEVVQFANKNNIVIMAV